MAQLRDLVRRLQTQPSMALVMGLGLGAVVLFLGAVVGAVAVSDTHLTAADGPRVSGGDASSDSTLPSTTASTDATGQTIDPATGAPIDPKTGKPLTTAGGGGPSGTLPGGGRVNTPGATRTGVTDKAVKFALHAPVTFDGAPLNLAEDPLEGVSIFVKFLNERQGGVNGRAITYQVFDDRYTVAGASKAATDIVNYNPFFISGTLGVDQVAVVAAEARKRAIPYMAAGGSESLFKDIGMFQIAASYDTHLSMLADFLAAESAKPPTASPYSGMKRVGVTQLDSPYISPAVEVFKQRLASHGMSLTKVVKIQKPTEQTSYGPQIQGLKDAPGGPVQIVVPAQDPISTSRMVQECISQQCPWKWSFSNFAHDGDVALQLMGGTWAGYRGLSSGCYYMPGEFNPYDTTKCAQMKSAHEQWVAINGEDDWQKDGQGGASGYQIVHFWLKALKDGGADPTREKFLASLHAYNGYNDLVTAPISFSGSANTSHGVEKMVPFEAGSNLKFKQLTPTFVSGF